MSRFEPGVRVFVIDENNKMKKGVINVVHESVNIAIVKFDDDTVSKVNITSLGICTDEPTQAEPKEPVEKTEIIITPKEFKEIALDLIKEETKDMGEGTAFLSLTFMIFVTKLHKALFFDTVEND